MILYDTSWVFDGIWWLSPDESIWFLIHDYIIIAILLHQWVQRCRACPWPWARCDERWSPGRSPFRLSTWVNPMWRVSWFWGYHGVPQNHEELVLICSYTWEKHGKAMVWGNHRYIFEETSCQRCQRALFFLGGRGKYKMRDIIWPYNLLTYDIHNHHLAKELT